MGKLSVIHGDPVFTNILLNKNCEFKFIDMKVRLVLLSICFIGMSTLLFAQNQELELVSEFDEDGEPSQTVLDFDGVDDYVEIDNTAGLLAGLSNYTIEFWMKADLNDQTSSIRTSLFSINPS